MYHPHVLTIHIHPTIRPSSILLAALVPCALCHMSLINPKPRNAIDSQLPYWSEGKWWPYLAFCPNPKFTPHWARHDKNWNPQIPSGCVPAGTDGWGYNLPPITLLNPV